MHLFFFKNVFFILFKKSVRNILGLKNVYSFKKTSKHLDKFAKMKIFLANTLGNQATSTATIFQNLIFFSIFMHLKEYLVLA